MVRPRHQTVSCGVKKFGIVRQRSRDNLDFHQICFHSVANLVQLTLIHELPLFEFEYNE